MRPFVLLSALLPLALASPVSQSQDIQARQLSGSEANDVKSGSCHDVTFIFARGSTEMGNMVRTHRFLLVLQNSWQTIIYRESLSVPEFAAIWSRNWDPWAARVLEERTQVASSRTPCRKTPTQEQSTPQSRCLKKHQASVRRQRSLLADIGMISSYTGIGTSTNSSAVKVVPSSITPSRSLTVTSNPKWRESLCLASHATCKITGRSPTTPKTRLRFSVPLETWFVRVLWLSLLHTWRTVPMQDKQPLFWLRRCRVRACSYMG